MCPVFVARDLSASFMIRAASPARNAAMEACHPAWFRSCGACGARDAANSLHSCRQVSCRCPGQAMNSTAAADVAPVEMWTTLFALATSPQVGSAVSARIAASRACARSCMRPLLHAAATAEGSASRTDTLAMPGIALRNGMQWAAGLGATCPVRSLRHQLDPHGPRSQQRCLTAVGSTCRPAHSRPAGAAPNIPPNGRPDIHAPAPSP